MFRFKILFSWLLEHLTSICKNMDGLGGDYGKWQSDRERQTLCDFTYLQNLKMQQASEHTIKEEDSQI